MLPVYVADEYEGFDAKPYPDLTDDELEHYLAPTSPPCARWPSARGPTSALANHLVMGPVILARGLRRACPTRSRSTAAR